jgi:hypothetical protein
MSRTLRKRTDRKTKKSYSLSSESVEFLEMLLKKRHAPSVSAVLEEILQAARRADARSALDRSVVGYYASLSREESRELASWGDFALREFPNEDA